MNRGHNMRPKRNRPESLGCHDRHPPPRVCFREPGSRDVITDNGATSSVPKWYVTTTIDIYMTSPSVCLWKIVQRRQDYLTWWLIKFRTQYSTKTGLQTKDVWRILWRQREHEAVATGFSWRPYETPWWWWIWHAVKIYGITTLCLTDSLHWRHNDHDSVSNHQPHGCLLNRLFRRRSKKTSKLRVTGFCVGNSPGPVNSPHKGPVTRKMFPFEDVIMLCRNMPVYLEDIFLIL